MATYQIPQDVEQEIKERISTGRYSTGEDVLRDAFSALKWRDEELTAIQEGIDDMETGRVKPLREFDREFRDRKNIPNDP